MPEPEQQHVLGQNLDSFVIFIIISVIIIILLNHDLDFLSD